MVVGIHLVPGRSSLTEPKEEAVHLFFYLADEEGKSFDTGRQDFEHLNTILLASGSRNDVGSWELHLQSTVRRTTFYLFVDHQLLCSFFFFVSFAKVWCLSCCVL